MNRCTGAVDCPHCDALIARAELARGETVGDEWDVRRAEAAAEALAYNEPPTSAHTTRREARNQPRDNARRAAAWLLGRTA